MKIKLNQITISIFIKYFVQILMTYLILAKGDAGRLVHDFGIMLHQGNALSGFFRLIFLFIVYLIIIVTVTHKCRQQLRTMLFLYVFDVVLILINLFGGIVIYTKLYEMPLDDAVFKFVTLTDGSTIIYVLFGLLILIPIKKSLTSKQS